MSIRYRTLEETERFRKAPRCEVCGSTLYTPEGAAEVKHQCQGFRPTTNPGRQAVNAGPFYTGVGSRATPPQVLETITEIAIWLRKKGYTLRTGEARGADAAFRAGAKLNSSVYRADDNTLQKYDQAREIAKEHHPAWGACREWSRRLHTRNVYQVLGDTLVQPSQFLVCWTVDGVETHTTRRTGGTGQAIRIAITYGVPVINLGRSCDWRKRLTKIFQGC